MDENYNLPPIPPQQPQWTPYGQQSQWTPYGQSAPQPDSQPNTVVEPQQQPTAEPEPTAQQQWQPDQQWQPEQPQQQWQPEEPQQQWQPEQPQQQWQPEQTTLPPDDQQSAPIPPVLPPQPKKKKGKGLLWLLIALGVLLLAGLGVGAYFLFFQKPNQPALSAGDDWDNEEEIVNRQGNDVDTGDDTYIIEEAEGTIDTPDDVEPAPQPAIGTQYLLMKGDADGYPLSLRLTINSNGQVTGKYKNEQNGSTVNVTGTRTNGVFSLRGSSGNTTYTFRIAPDRHIYTGTFSSSAGQNYELHLTAEEVDATQVN